MKASKLLRLMEHHWMLAASSVDVDTFDGDRVNHPINAERQTGYFPSCREDGSSLQEKAARKRSQTAFTSEVLATYRLGQAGRISARGTVLP